jgi:hypothetical protein
VCAISQGWASATLQQMAPPLEFSISERTYCEFNTSWLRAP